MGKITYTRGTTLKLTHTYTAPQYFGASLIFTVKTVQNDSDATDLTNAVMTPKEIPMSGSSFPQTTVIPIAPTDVAITMDPSTNYFYSIKVIDSNGDEYMCDSGTFILAAQPTNETS
jgi:hypothetical protein